MEYIEDKCICHISILVDIVHTACIPQRRVHASAAHILAIMTLP